MVDITGHVAFGLLFALPAWHFWTGRTSVAFVAIAAVASLLPDIDLWLAALFPQAVHHHGVTHTVVFVTGSALVGGVILAALFAERFDDWTGSGEFGRRRSFLFSFLGILAGGLAHVFADMLSAPDVSTPIEPLWPFVEGSWGIDLVWYNARWINVGFLAVMVVVHVAIAYLTTTAGQRRRLFSR